MAERVRPKVVIRVGHVWMSHREYAAVQGWTKRPWCDGELRFIHTDGVHKEAECDRCRFLTTATADQVRAAVVERDKLVEVLEWRRGQWWND